MIVSVQPHIHDHAHVVALSKPIKQKKQWSLNSASHSMFKTATTKNRTQLKKDWNKESNFVGFCFSCLIIFPSFDISQYCQIAHHFLISCKSFFDCFAFDTFSFPWGFHVNGISLEIHRFIVRFSTSSRYIHLLFSHALATWMQAA